MQRKKRGFTLLEILLVIAAIGILAAIVLVAINPNRQLAQVRNAERRSEINTLYKALEQYLIEKQGYPSGITGIEQDICINGNTSNCVNLGVGVLVPDYVAGIPVDPSGTSYKIGIVDGRVRVRSAGAELGVVIALSGSGGTVLGSTGPSDPHWNNVSLLMKFNGANNSTTFTDSSNSNRVPSITGDVKISTTQNKFGGSSGLFSDASNMYLQYTPSTDLQFTGDFTIEGWFYLNSLDNTTFGSSSSDGNTQIFRFNEGPGGNLPSTAGNLSFYLNGTQVLGATGAGIQAGIWYHVALSRSGSLTRAFVNGIQVGPTNTSWTGSFSFNVLGKFFFSGSPYGSSFNGYVDELRITKGVARYTANFTPPTESFPTN